MPRSCSVPENDEALVFPTLQNSYERFTENLALLRWILLKTVISIFGNGQKYITDTCVSRFYTFQDDREKSYSGSESEMKQICVLTASVLASSASYFLTSWQKPSRFFATTVEYFLQYFKIFHVNFQRSKSLAGY